MTTEIATASPASVPASTLDFRALKEFADYIGQDAWGIYARMAKAKAYGLDPAHYDECIDILNISGRKQFSLSTKAMGALIKRHPRYDYAIVKFEEDEAQIKFTDSVADVEYVHSMTRKEADAAGYSKAGSSIKDGWKKQPKLMLFYRCLAQGTRIFCPDVLGGANAYDQDEIPTIIEGEYREVVAESSPPALATPPPSTLPAPSSLERAVAWCRAGVGSPSYTAAKADATSNKALELVADHHGININSAEAWVGDWTLLDAQGRMNAVVALYDTGQLPDLTADVIDAQVEVEAF